jgi:hypothetical protein
VWFGWSISEDEFLEGLIDVGKGREGCQDGRESGGELGAGGLEGMDNQGVGVGERNVSRFLRQVG